MRVRFAPSPTGYLHVGSARTALFNWLLARSSGGTFILRSDDTDRERSSVTYQDDILAGLRWLEIDWDEGVEVGGPHAPYRQSERLDRYRAVAEMLLADGRAYRCFCTPEELDARRAQAQAEGRPPGYDGRCRLLDAAAGAARTAAGDVAVVRLAIPRPGATAFEDLVRGEVRFDHDHVEDFVLLRSDGSPTYQLASAVDDVDFEITHVVRGEDLLSSTPKHILVAGAMGAGPPRYAHLSLLHGSDGRKLSKRHGDTALHAYREAGFLPEAMVNYLALLGWSFGDDETVFPRHAMAERFRIEDVSKNPAVFDNEKLAWMNGVYIRELPAADFAGRSRPFLEADVGRELAGEEWDRYRRLAPTVQERVRLLGEAAEQVRFLFVDSVVYDEASWNKVMTGPGARPALEGARRNLTGLAQWEVDGIEAALRAMLEEAGLSARKGLQPVRVAVTGSSISPPLFESLEALGRETALARLEGALGRL